MLLNEMIDYFDELFEVKKKIPKFGIFFVNIF